MTANPLNAAGQLAIDIAALAKSSIGPDGNMLRVSEEDAPMVRSAFISRISEAAMQILDGEVTP
jgi:hypothetical protein